MRRRSLASSPSYLAPTFVIGGATYTLDPVRLVVSDGDKRPFPLLPNPTMFSINGFNYVIDTNRMPHAIVGNDNVSPLATDVTVDTRQPDTAFDVHAQRPGLRVRRGRERATCSRSPAPRAI